LLFVILLRSCYCTSVVSSMLFSSDGAHLDLHSFPTRRSSDLTTAAPTRCRACRSGSPRGSWPSSAATAWARRRCATPSPGWCGRSEEHTSELQSHLNLVCRLLLEKKKKQINTKYMAL